MVVNLSLEKSSKVQLKLGAAQARMVSPVDGSFLALEEGNSFWLTAGQGALIKLQ